MGHTEPAVAAEDQRLRFPAGFTWGTATSAYQIEGAWNEGGRGVSIWDTFCRQPGRVERGETGDGAADHFHRWAEDMEIMAGLGLNAYRFSIAWPRVMPAGTAPVNPAGLDFYDRLVDALLARGIQPFPTLYHWDLPQTLQDRGGWTRRETAGHFADFARVVVVRLGDRVTQWITHNEPFIAAILGHFTGEHAPGMRNLFAAGRATHHLLLSHGLAVEAMRAAAPRPLKIGIALNLSPTYPSTPTGHDRRAARLFDGLINRAYLDPLFRARYPDDLRLRTGLLLPRIQPGDMECIAAPIDFLGVNYYAPTRVRRDWKTPLIFANQARNPDGEHSEMWEIYPDGLLDLLRRLHADYSPAHIFITENGMPVPDRVEADGCVHDAPRIHYLRRHLARVQAAIAEGIPVCGYFVWSLLDNFEWAYGYRMRFGLVHVDFETGARTLKDSAKWYAGVVRANAVM